MPTVSESLNALEYYAQGLVYKLVSHLVSTFVMGFHDVNIAEQSPLKTEAYWFDSCETLAKRTQPPCLVGIS
jgi:hypothetical protein